jgi:hypothetical protein
VDAPITPAAGAQAATDVAAVVATAEPIADGTALRIVTAGGGTSMADLALVPPVVGIGPSGLSLAGLPPTGRSSFGSGTSPSERADTSRRSGSDQRPTPSAPPRPLPGLASGGGSGGASGSSGGGGTPAAALLDPATAPAASTLGAVTATERRVTWWYPEIVVSPG